MKYLQLLIILLFISSCCSTKRITETPSDKPKTEIVEITKDSAVPEIETIKTTAKTNTIVKTDTIKVSESEISESTNTEEKGKTDEFNQILTKRSITVHQLWNELLQKHVSNEGNVDYKSFKTEHKKLLDYIYVLSLLYKHDAFKSISKEEKLAFWINAYNALTIDLILRHYPVNSIKDIKDPWKQRLWKLAEIPYNLEEIEHEILRKMNEPRIHFAIVCASFSCPKLQNEAFTAFELENQLTTATREFLSDSKRNEISENSIKLSKIFQWFSKDFKQNRSLIDFLNQYSEIIISSKAKKSFKDYDWALNE